MKATIDFDERLYRRLEAEAAMRSNTVKAQVTEGVRQCRDLFPILHMNHGMAFNLLGQRLWCRLHAGYFFSRASRRMRSPSEIASTPFPIGHVWSPPCTR